MTNTFFPGCKIKARYPEASEKLREAVIEHGFADEVAGCCRVNHQKLDSGDTAVCACNNCMAMIDEDAKSETLDNVWVLIDNEPSFQFPDYGGKVVAVQDCGRAYDRSDVQDAVRSILRKMNLKVLECDDAREKSRYCGASFLMEAPKQDAGFAPMRYVKDAEVRGVFQPHSKDEQVELLKRHASAIPCEDVVCYCTACDAGLETGGKHPVNLIELVFGEFRARDWPIPFEATRIHS